MVLDIAGIASTPVWAQSTALTTEPAQTKAPDKASDKAKTTNLEGVTVPGSRRVGSSETGTPVPVDVISIDKIAEQSPQFDLSQSLQYGVPSFTSTRQDPNETDNGFRYEAVQFGLNGAAWFMRLAVKF